MSREKALMQISQNVGLDEDSNRPYPTSRVGALIRDTNTLTNFILCVL